MPDIGREKKDRQTDREREREAEAEGGQNTVQLQMMMQFVLMSGRATCPDTPVNQKLVGLWSML